MRRTIVSGARDVTPVSPRSPPLLRKPNHAARCSRTSRALAAQSSLSVSFLLLKIIKPFSELNPIIVSVVSKGIAKAVYLSSRGCRKGCISDNVHNFVGKIYNNVSREVLTYKIK